MNIYLIQRTDGWSYDDYDEMVVIAKSHQQAKKITMEVHSGDYSGWVKDIKDLNSQKVGVADKGYGILLESFNAG